MPAYLALIFLAISLPALAFNPRSVPRHQKNAPEQLEIEVTGLEEKEVKMDGMTYLSIKAQAQVQKVIKSATGLKSGKTIQVFWLIPQNDAGIGGGWPGKIQKGRHHAYLRADEKDGTHYIPAAYTGTFVAGKKP